MSTSSFRLQSAVSDAIEVKWYSTIFLLLGTILAVADPVTDILTLREFYLNDHKTWFRVGLVFVILPSLLLSCLYYRFHVLRIFIICILEQDDDEEESEILEVFSIPDLLFGWNPLSLPYTRLQAFIWCSRNFKKLSYETLEEDCDKNKEIKSLIKDETWYGMFEAIVESAPQFIIQLYVTIVQQEQVSTILMVSLCVSFLSLAWTSTNADVWCFVAVGNSLDKKYSPKKFITKTFFLISQIFHLSSRLFAITFFSVAFKWWIVVVVMFHNIAIAYVALWAFRADNQPCDKICTPIFMFLHGVFYWIRDDGACGLHFEDGDLKELNINVKIVKNASNFLFVIENVIMISVFYSKEELHSWYSVPVTVCVCVFSLVGCLMRVAICRYFLRE